MCLRTTKDQQVFLNLSLSFPSGGDLLVTSVPIRSTEGPSTKMFRECPKTSIFFWVSVVFFLMFDHVTKHRVEGRAVPFRHYIFSMYIRILCCLWFLGSSAYHKVQPFIISINVLTGMLDSIAQNIPLSWKKCRSQPTISVL